MVSAGYNLWRFQICFVRYHIYDANFIKFGMAVDLLSPVIDPVKPSLFGGWEGGEFFTLTVFRFEINFEALQKWATTITHWLCSRHQWTVHWQWTSPFKGTVEPFSHLVHRLSNPLGRASRKTGYKGGLFYNFCWRKITPWSDDRLVMVCYMRFLPFWFLIKRSSLLANKNKKKGKSLWWICIQKYWFVAHKVCFLKVHIICGITFCEATEQNF